MPDDVRDALAQRAAARGQSLQAYLLELVRAEAATNRNADILRRFDHRSDGVRLPPGGAKIFVEEARAERLDRMLHHER